MTIHQLAELLRQASREFDADAQKQPDQNSWTTGYLKGQASSYWSAAALIEEELRALALRDMAIAK